MKISYPCFKRLISVFVKGFETQTDLGDVQPIIDKDTTANFSLDQVLEFSYEGSGSLAGSLSSIESGVRSVDLSAEFNALGYRFKKLADMFKDDSDSEEEYSNGEVEV
ncbi:cadherin-2 [Eurytemora carolleeae]|uniref:cadherin-2 n=1 Tax=Eurytemora carolleeae TaxID=1294199 RepID=UPI000C77F0F1|nr:cadherin-2 [Eurytemora carolleeae]|eukprot:XP_023328069.1 cadherin-2-like [Eurytemora affinis]